MRDTFEDTFSWYSHPKTHNNTQGIKDQRELRELQRSSLSWNSHPKTHNNTHGIKDQSELRELQRSSLIDLSHILSKITNATASTISN
jgi:hypothetical protein